MKYEKGCVPRAFYSVLPMARRRKRSWSLQARRSSEMQNISGGKEGLGPSYRACNAPAFPAPQSLGSPVHRVFLWHLFSPLFLSLFPVYGRLTTQTGVVLCADTTAIPSLGGQVAQLRLRLLVEKTKQDNSLSPHQIKSIKTKQHKESPQDFSCWLDKSVHWIARTMPPGVIFVKIKVNL